MSQLSEIEKLVDDYVDKIMQGHDQVKGMSMAIGALKTQLSMLASGHATAENMIKNMKDYVRR